MFNRQKNKLKEILKDLADDMHVFNDPETGDFLVLHGPVAVVTVENVEDGKFEEIKAAVAEVFSLKERKNEN